MDEVRWLRCTGPEPMLAFLRDKVSERLLRRFSIACHRRLIPITSAEVRTWFDEAERAADGVGVASADSPVAGGDFTFESFSTGDSEPTTLIRWPPRFYVQAVANHPGTAATSPGERAVQCRLLRDIVGNPFRPVAFQTAWLEHEDYRVPRIARTIYEEERFDGLPVLADALLDAGCDDEAIVAHLRGPGPHVRGCWALDLCLGRRLVHGAIVGGDARLLTALVRSGADLAFLANEVGQRDGEESPLTLAARHGHVEVVKTLLDAGADPRGVDRCGETPMSVAARGGRLEIVRLLLAGGGDGERRAPRLAADRRGDERARGRGEGTAPGRGGGGRGGRGGLVGTGDRGLPRRPADGAPPRGSRGVPHPTHRQVRGERPDRGGAEYQPSSRRGGPLPESVRHSRAGARRRGSSKAVRGTAGGRHPLLTDSPGPADIDASHRSRHSAADPGRLFPVTEGQIRLRRGEPQVPVRPTTVPTLSVGSGRRFSSSHEAHHAPALVVALLPDEKGAACRAAPLRPPL
jgi:hypothetical protein